MYEGLSTLPAIKGLKAPNGVEVCLKKPEWLFLAHNKHYTLTTHSNRRGPLLTMSRQIIVDKMGSVSVTCHLFTKGLFLAKQMSRGRREDKKKRSGNCSKFSNSRMNNYVIETPSSASKVGRPLVLESLLSKKSAMDHRCPRWNQRLSL